MARPSPQVGLIIRYEYLWKSQYQEGLSKGEKHRPCVIILVPAPAFGEPPKALVCPLTHSAPQWGDIGVEIPDEEKAPMGLDGEPQWVIASEANLLKDWDDPGVIELAKGGWVYGIMPRVLLATVRERYQAAYGERGAGDTVTMR